MSARQVVVFEAAAEWYAVPLEQVREILTARQLRPVPAAGRGVAGLILWRGRIIPVLDLAACLGVHCEIGERAGAGTPRFRHSAPTSMVGAAQRIIIVRWPHREVGWLVESVEAVMAIAMESIQPPLGVADPGVVSGMVPVNGRILMLLDSLALGAALAGESITIGERG